MLICSAIFRGGRNRMYGKEAVSTWGIGHRPARNGFNLASKKSERTQLLSEIPETGTAPLVYKGSRQSWLLRMKIFQLGF
jgi:hypothetical protein